MAWLHGTLFRDAIANLIPKLPRSTPGRRHELMYCIVLHCTVTGPGRLQLEARRRGQAVSHRTRTDATLAAPHYPYSTTRTEQHACLEALFATSHAKIKLLLLYSERWKAGDDRLGGLSPPHTTTLRVRLTGSCQQPCNSLRSRADA